MKTRILSAISLLTLAAFTVTAGEALLSPRAKSNLPANGTVVNSSAAVVKTTALESPRAATAKITVISGIETPTVAKCTAIGTPRQADMFGSCCKVAPTLCKGKAGTAACCAK